MNKYELYYNATLNEIAIDKESLKRLFNIHMDFIPIRAFNTYNFIKKYNISKYLYLIPNLLFFIFYPFIALFFMIIQYQSKYTQLTQTHSFRKIALNSHHKLQTLLEKNRLEKNTMYIDIKKDLVQEHKNHIHFTQLLDKKDFLLAYIYSLISLVYLFYKLEKKTNLLQGYTSYHWFLVYIALQKIENDSEVIYFSNHYDRWSVMYDSLFKNKNLIHLQHGILPTELILPYKLSNIKSIYTFDKKSIEIYSILFNNKKVTYLELNNNIVLTDISTSKFSILIIGQPHSIDKEVEIINELDGNYDIYIKPHPLYSPEKYKNSNYSHLIKDKSFFPRVNLALCYESTLGLEYEKSGINVLWWKDMEISNILKKISCYKEALLVQ